MQSSENLKPQNSEFLVPQTLEAVKEPSDQTEIEGVLTDPKSTPTLPDDASDED